MKKLVIAMLLAGVTLGLTACGEKKPEPPKASAVAVPPPVASGSDAMHNTKFNPALGNANPEFTQKGYVFAGNNNEMNNYIDKNNIDTVNHTARVIFEYIEGQYKGSYTVETMEANCNNNMFRVNTVDWYNYETKKIIKRFSRDWQKSNPSGFGGRMVSILCGREPIPDNLK